MAFFGNKRKDFSIQPPKQQVDGTPFYVTDSANIDFTLANLNLTANLTQLLPTSGTYGSSTLIPILQIDQWGRITGVTTTTFSASGITLEVNSTPNLSQTILNLTSGTDIQVVDLGGGVIEFNYIGTVGSAAWGTIGAGTGVGSQTDLVAYLNLNYYPLSTNPAGYLTTIFGLNISLLINDSGYITSSALTPYLTITSAAATYQPLLATIKSVKIVSNNVELDNDLVSPGNNKVYGTDVSGNRGWKADPTGGGNSIGELTSDVTAGPASSPSQSVAATLATSYKSGSCSVVFDGAGGVITSGTTAYAQVPYNGTIASWTIVSSVSGSCTVTVFKDTYANFPPIISTDNVFTVQPALATQVKNQNLSPTFVGSQATVTTGDWIGFTISGITTATWANLTLSITKTV